MEKKVIFTVILSLFLGNICHLIAGVRWTSDGIGISTATGDQISAKIVSNGTEGTIITWEDSRSGNSDIYCQKFDSTGADKWTSNGIAICTATGNQTFSTIVSDGTGGAIIAWMDSRGSSNDIYCQKVDSTGTVKWTANGVAICTTSNNQNYPRIASDGVGGAFITWRDFRSGNWDVYIQRISNNAPTVIEITPESGINTGTVSITNLTGTGFSSGTTVKLTKIGQNDINGTNVTVVSPTQITCSFDLTNATEATWNVTVTNID